MHNPPPTIQRSDILFNEPAREDNKGIPELAESIASDTGLIQPIVLAPVIRDGLIRYVPVDGRRRLSGCDYLGVSEFHHGHVSVKGKPGYVLTEAEPDESTKLMLELTANQHRLNFTWQQEMSLLIRAYNAAWKVHGLQGKKYTYEMFGQQYGYTYMEVASAMQVHGDYETCAEDYGACQTIQQAYLVKLSKAKKSVEAEAARRLQAKATANQSKVKEQFIPTPETPHEKPRAIFPLSNYKLGNSIEYLESLDGPVYDAIVTDPDFAISVERLSANSESASLGVIQSSVSESLDDLRRFIEASFRALHDHGYLVFFYDLDHHEKLQTMCAAAGFAVQRWPITWHKVGFGSNANPTKNTTKDIEYAMVASKPKAQLAKAASGSVISVPLAGANDRLGHPFAKPADLWRALFQRFVQPKFVVFDAFMGSGSMPLAALGLDFTVHGMELNPDHYNRCLLNLRDWATTNLGSDVEFV